MIALYRISFCAEALTGLSTIRAYRSQVSCAFADVLLIFLRYPQEHFITTSNQGLDQENRAYYMTIAIQRWLAVRLDILGNSLILGIGLFAAGFRNTVDPSKIGVVLSYTLSSTHTKLPPPRTQNLTTYTVPVTQMFC